MMNSENVKGKLIVLEGLDHCFKETNAKRLTEYISTNFNEKTILMSYPDYESESSCFVRKFLAGEYGELKEVGPYTISMFYALDRYDDKKRIDLLLAQGYTVILDRYVGSNLLNQSARYENESDMIKYIDWNLDLEYTKNGVAKEDITLFMYVPVELNYGAMSNRSDKAGVGKDIFEKDKNVQLAIEKSSHYIADRLKWNIVECYKDITIFDKDTIFSNILDILNNTFDVTIK